MPTPNMKLAEYKALPQKRSKYRNTAVVIDGIRFASKREGKCWVELKALEYAKKITGLRRQVRIPIHVPHWKTGEPIIAAHWVADFVFIEDGVEIWADAKGWPSDVYRLKKRMIYAEYGVEIREL